MTNDGFSLDDKRQKQADNDIPDILECWRNRKNEEFYQIRASKACRIKNGGCADETRQIKFAARHQPFNV